LIAIFNHPFFGGDFCIALCNYIILRLAGRVNDTDGALNLPEHCFRSLMCSIGNGQLDGGRIKELNVCQDVGGDFFRQINAKALGGDDERACRCQGSEHTLSILAGQFFEGAQRTQFLKFIPVVGAFKRCRFQNQFIQLQP